MAQVETHTITALVQDRPGVLAHVLGELSHAGINVREMENVICKGEEGACAQIRLDSEPSSEVLVMQALSGG